MAIQVAVHLLSAREEVNRSVDEGFEFRIFMMLQIGARRLKPFGHVRVPEDTTSPVPAARLLPAAVHALIESQGIQMALVPHFIVNVAKSDLSYLLLQLAPETASERNARLIKGLPGG